MPLKTEERPATPLPQVSLWDDSSETIDVLGFDNLVSEPREVLPETLFGPNFIGVHPVRISHSLCAFGQIKAAQRI